MDQLFSRSASIARFNYGMPRRENTFRIDLANIPKRPSYEEVHTFVATELGLQREQVQRIQCSRSANCVFVKVVDLELAQKVCDEHDKKHEIVVDGEKHVLRILMEDGAVEVKLFDLPEDISEQCIVDFLRDFGEVLSIREQMWTDQYTFGGVSTGVWIARMVVKRNIPSYVTIDGETTFLSYYGQLQSCKHCGEYVHNGASCVQNKKLLIQKMSADTTTKQSYANVARKPMKPSAAAAIRQARPSAANQHPNSTAPKPPTETTATNSSPSTSTVSTLPVAFKKPSVVQHQYQLRDKKQQTTKTNRDNDGAETDESSSSNTSRSSRRHTEKKARYNDVEISPDEAMGI